MAQSFPMFIADLFDPSGSGMLMQLILLFAIIGIGFYSIMKQAYKEDKKTGLGI